MEFKADQYAVNAFKDCKYIRDDKTEIDHGEDITHGLQHALIKAFKKNSANLNPDWLYAANYLGQWLKDQQHKEVSIVQQLD